MFSSGLPLIDDRLTRLEISGERISAKFTGLAIKNLNTFDLSPDNSRVVFSTTSPGTSDLLAIDNLPAPLKDAQ